jgi:hypothetical protein
MPNNSTLFYLLLKDGWVYFFLKKILIGTPVKLNCSRKRFSMKRLYDSLTY